MGSPGQSTIPRRLQRVKPSSIIILLKKPELANKLKGLLPTQQNVFALLFSLLELLCYKILVQFKKGPFVLGVYATGMVRKGKFRLILYPYLSYRTEIKEKLARHART